MITGEATPLLRCVVNNKNADYRKMNDHSHCSSTYHKKDGTAVRAILKRETDKAAKTA